MKRYLVSLILVALTACTQASATAPTATQTPEVALAADRGEVLFLNKGCATCHTHAHVDGATGIIGDYGPNLSRYTNDPSFLQRWLADPAAVRPGTQMPNLQLSQAEIDDLIAFLNTPR